MSKRLGERTYSRANGGTRDDLGFYVRSAWEANYARYLKWLESLGNIDHWEYEPETFEFVGIKRGNCFYTPDFKVYNSDGTVEYHEVKGWMDQNSKVKLKRMAKYYPTVKIVVIDSEQYYAIARVVRNIVPNWETRTERSTGSEALR
jgi:hypothetical protein